MIVAVSLNPALDITYRLDTPLDVGGTNRVAEVTVRPGGKALNVARVLGELNRSVRVVAPAGGTTGTSMRREAVSCGIDGVWVPVAGQTRRTVVTWDRASGVATSLNEPGPEISGSEWNGLLGAVGRLMPADALVVSGSVSPGLPVDAVAQIVQIGNAAAIPVVVDTSSPTLLAAIDAGATIVKPNRDEIAGVLGRDVGATSADVVAAAEELRAGGRVCVVASDGPNGLVAVTPNGRWRAEPPRLGGVNATGAGDACVAGLVAAMLDGDDWPGVLRLSAALGAAAARRPVAGEVGDYGDLYAATHVEEL